MARTTTDAAGRTVPTTRRSFGTVRRLPSKAWQASYRGPDGQRHNADHTFEAKAHADAWLATVQASIRHETWRSPEVRTEETFGEVAAAWLAQRRNRHGEPLRAKTLDDYRRSLEGGLASFADVALTDLTAARVRSWHAERSARSGATTAAKEARLVRAIMTTAVADGAIAKNPVPSELTRARTGREFRPPTTAELAVLRDAIADRFKLAIAVAAFGGLRLSEWRALRRRDLTLTSGGSYAVNVARQALRVGGQWLVTAPKSVDGVRVIHLPDWLTEDVRVHLDRFVGTFPDSLVFESGGVGEFVDQSWRRAWDAARDVAGVRAVVREHDLRHYYGTMLAASGVSAMQVKSAMGTPTLPRRWGTSAPPMERPPTSPTASPRRPLSSGPVSLG